MDQSKNTTTTTTTTTAVGADTDAEIFVLLVCWEDGCVVEEARGSHARCMGAARALGDDTYLWRAIRPLVKGDA